MPQPLTEIPTYRLYGDNAEIKPASFRHIETVAERSTLYDWEISPHRHRHSVQVLIVAEGAVTASLDGRAIALDGPCYVIVPVGAVHGFRFDPGTRGWVLTLGQDFAGRARAPADPLGRLLAECEARALSPEVAERVSWLAEELLRQGRDWSGFGPFLALAEALLRSLPVQGTPTESADARRLALFRQLIETHLREHRGVSFYAASLGMTERTFTRLCRRALGSTPLEVINGRLTLEAHRMLRYTNATVAQVAAELGFADPSYFSRFYARMSGRRPAAERA